MPADPPPTPRFSRALEASLREEAAARGRRRPRGLPSLRALVPAAALLAALAFVLLPRAGDDRDERVGGAGSTGPPVLRVSSNDLLAADRPEIERLQREFRRRGAVLAVRDRWVRDPSADGRVFAVMMPPGIGNEVEGAGDDRRSRVVPFTVDDRLPGPIIVVVGKAGGEKPEPSNKTIYEAIPILCDLVEPTDPAGTERALRDAGFDVVVTNVPWKTEGLKPVVISLLDGEGRYRNVDPDTKQLIMEVGTPGEGHGATGDAGCR